MDKLLVGCASIVFVYIAVVVFVQEVLPFLIYVLPLPAVASLVVILIGEAEKRRFRRALESPSVAAGMIALTLVGERLELVACQRPKLTEDRLLRFGGGLVAAASVIALFLAVYYRPGPQGHVEDAREVLAGVIVLSLSVLSFVIIADGSVKRRGITAAVSDLGWQLNATSVHQLRRLTEMQTSCESLAAGVGLSWPEKWLFSRVAAFVSSEAPRVIADQAVLGVFMEDLHKAAENERAELVYAIERHALLLRLHAEASMVVARTASRTLLKLADALYEQVSRLKDGPLAARDWRGFHCQADQIEAQIRRLESDAGRFQSPPPSAFDTGIRDPWEVLGVTREMSLVEIKKVYRELCGIYHPDKAKVKDARRFIEIKAAYDAIAASG